MQSIEKFKKYKQNKKNVTTKSDEKSKFVFDDKIKLETQKSNSAINHQWRNKQARMKKTKQWGLRNKKVKKKTKKLSRWKLVKKLDNVFSLYIRLKQNKKWKCQCYTCWVIKHYKEMQNWHYITRWNYKYRWDEDNCKVQCYVCNIIKSWNYQIYTIKMIDEYWRSKVEKMINDNEIKKISTNEIKEKIEYYQNIVDDLLDNLLQKLEKWT